MKNDSYKTEKRYWKSLDHLAGRPETQNSGHEHAHDAAELPGRRKFLALMGTSLSLAGLAGCRKPVEKIIPYVTPPEEIVPGIPQYYATTMPFGSASFGLIVESHEGRPTKIEGNDNHPDTLGASNAFMQAAIPGLYDPDRSRDVLHNGSVESIDTFFNVWGGLHAGFIRSGGEGLAVLTGPHSSPTLGRLEREFRAKFPRARWVVYEPVSDENIYAGIEAATGMQYRPQYHFDKAKRILAIDSDFLHMDTDNITNARGFAERRKITSENGEMNRLYAVESVYSATGAAADHRLRLQSRQIGPFVAALVLELRRQGVNVSGTGSVDFGSAGAISSEWISEAARDLIRHRGESIVIGGRRQPPGVHALIFAINDALGNNGSTIQYRSMAHSAIPRTDALKELADDLRSGTIDTLVIADSNPVYDAPADLEFSRAVGAAARIIHFGLYRDETAEFAEWHVPQAHFLESWGDAGASDGTLSVIQPLIQPLFNGTAATEFFHLLGEGTFRAGYDVVRDTWQNILRRGDFEERWRRVLHDGVLSERTVAGSAPAVNAGSLSRMLNENPFPAEAANADNLEIVFTASPSVYDGRFANNGWLHELPGPVTKLTWDNAAIISPKTAESAGVENGDMVRLSYGGRELDMPVWIVPGQADYSVSIDLGYGREKAGETGTGVGFNANRLRTVGAPGFGFGLTMTKTGDRYELASVQDHGGLEDRPLVIEATLEEYRHDPHLEHMKHDHPPLKSMWKEHTYDEGYQWGMGVDLSACTGCNACVLACQIENNVPIVGKEQVLNAREMHWLRIDRYFVSEGNNTEDASVLFQPMACQHCELAPCEQVCPVAATVHDKEGLNTMVYNRCIGTRYCSNNCPFKVRRFNFFNYTKDTPEVRRLGNNPEVTVRFRGVMEKCTYCIQRLSRAKNAAKLGDSVIADGTLQTACQQACPADAIVFGNINNPDSRVSQIKRQNKNYNMLEELNLKTRTSFLAKIRNPNPALDGD